jgi:hypothetical protein
MLPPTSEQAMSPNPGTSPAHCTGSDTWGDLYSASPPPQRAGVAEELERRAAKPSD